MTISSALDRRGVRPALRWLGLVAAALAAGAAGAQPFGSGVSTGPTTGSTPLQGETFLMSGSSYAFGTVAWASWGSVSYDPVNWQFGVVHGGGFEQLGTGPLSGSNAGATGPATGSITVGVDAGTLHAGASAFAAADTAASFDNSASASSIAAFGDFLTLSSAATVTFTGSIDGSLGFQGGGGSSVDFEIAAIDPASVGDSESGIERDTWGGFAIRYGVAGTANGPASGTQTFSFDVALPAGTSFIVASLVADAVAPHSAGGLPDASADALFGDTARLALLVPAGVQASSSGGLLVLTPVPEPASGALLGFGLVALGWLARRKPTGA